MATRFFPDCFRHDALERHLRGRLMALVGVVGAAVMASCGTQSSVELLTDLAYSANPAVYTKGSAITPNVASSAGGPAVSYSVAPSLPGGLALESSTGVISGTPDTVTPATDYVVTARNSKGSTAVVLNITIHDAPTVAPTGLRYASNPATYTKGVIISPNRPSYEGGTVNSYSVSPPLPAGLGLDSSTGIISGAPAAVVGTASYRVTATNPGGSTSAELSLTVNDLPPAGLTYASNPAVYAKEKAITPNVASSTGGAVVSFSASPSLPVGLSLDAHTGSIYGTPTAVTPTALYTVTASNSGGSASVQLSLTITDAAPANLRYARNPAVYLTGEVIPLNTPTTTGGAVTGYSVDPPLPGGLSLDSVTGAIYGAPTAVVDAGIYTVTASNAGASTQAGLSIAVLAALPTSGLVAHYPLDGDPRDGLGGANDGVAYGSVTAVADHLGVAGGALHFDGVSYVKASASALPSTLRTVSLWFRTVDFAGAPVLLGYGGNACGTSFIVDVAPTFMGAGAHCNYYPGVLYRYDTPPGPAWHHWAIVTASSGAWMYLDGQRVGAVASPYPTTYVAGRDLSLGVAVNYQGYAPYTDANITYFKGDLDEVRIYNRVLSDTEILALAFH